MEGFRDSEFTATSSVIKKRRTTTIRRPHPDMQFLVQGRDASSHAWKRPSDNGSKLCRGQNLACDSSFRRNEFITLSNSVPRIAPWNNIESSGIARNGSDSNRCGEGVIAQGSSDGQSWHVAGGSSGSAENKVKKMRFKLRINPKPSSEIDNTGSNANSLQPSDASRHRHNLIFQDNLDEDRTRGVKEDGLHGVRWKDFDTGDIPFPEPVRKSKRVPKRRVLDEDNENDEIRYLNKLKNSKVGAYCNPQRDISKGLKSKKSAYDVDEDYGSSRFLKESRKKSRMGREYDDAALDEEADDPKRRKQRNESVDQSTDVKNEPLTTRQRALQSTGGSLIEFPNGLPPAPPRKQKEKLSEEEQQAKKAEAAQRRKMQVEKAAKESEAEAIRKILGQDSNRKRKEEKMRRERDDMAQKRAANSLVMASNSIRWVIGPTGTIVTFGEGVGLPSIFGTKNSSYPPPREKCAGPSCTNTYKYRDSKLNLPLCSLQCYKAVRESSHVLSS